MKAALIRRRVRVLLLVSVILLTIPNIFLLLRMRTEHTKNDNSAPTTATVVNGHVILDENLEVPTYTVLESNAAFRSHVDGPGSHLVSKDTDFTLTLMEDNRKQDTHHVVYSETTGANAAINGAMTNTTNKPVVWVLTRVSKLKSGKLDHVIILFKRLGFVVEIADDEPEHWDVLWSVRSPFYNKPEVMRNLKPYQRVNHVPGTGSVTRKSVLSRFNHKTIPQSFRIPQDKKELLQYAEKYPDRLLVKKSTAHRGVKLVTVNEIDFNATKTMVQEFIDKPLLLGGRKFDIGMWTVVTSLNPLRLYIIPEKPLIRLCVKEYYPFNASDRAANNVASYTPLWDIPALKDLYYNDSLTPKGIVHTYFKRQGIDMTPIWREIEETVWTVYHDQHEKMLKTAGRFANNSRPFFELVRFDFIIDEKMKLNLMEVNFSPSLSTVYLAENRLLYEQVGYNALRVTGVASMLDNHFQNSQSYLQELRALFCRYRDTEGAEMEVADWDISVFAVWCAKAGQCDSHCDTLRCMTCMQCLTESQRQTYRDAFLEHVNRGSCSRVFPHKLIQKEALRWSPDDDFYHLEQYTESNKKMFLWFIGMCRKDATFCA